MKLVHYNGYSNMPNTSHRYSPYGDWKPGDEMEMTDDECLQFEAVYARGELFTITDASKSSKKQPDAADGGK